ncbi:unnamed protein product [Umbelopsis ramanniana]
MDFKLQLSNEILIIILQNLCPQDLVSCSHTCWTWNNAANPLLYETVSLSTCTMFQKFMESIIDPQNHDVSCVGNAIDRHQPLAQLVKTVDILVDYSEYDDLQNYSTMLSRLASKTPNVHTAKLFLPILCTVHGSRYSFDWSMLASQWTQLKSLTLRKALYYAAEEYNLNNINVVLNKLQHLDVAGCEHILNYMRPSLPSMPYLQSFMANVFDTDDYQALKEILETCQDTLHTLIIGFYSIFRPLSINLDDLKVGRKQLKAFGLTTHDDSQLHISNLGENLEHLEWWTIGNGGVYTLDHPIYQAMMKTSNLKTLSVAGNMALDPIPLVLEANKDTLHTFYFDYMNRDNLIEYLQAYKMRLYNVTTLCYEFWSLDLSDVGLLAEIFPNVEFLGLCRDRLQHERTRHKMMRTKGLQWITMDALSHFQQLKAIDEITFLELVDQSSSTYPKCNILRPKYTKRLRV